MPSITWDQTATLNSTLVDITPGSASVTITISTSGTVSAAGLIFEASTDGTNWVSMVGIVQSTFAIFTTWQPSFGSPVVLQFNIAGFTQYRVRLSTVITGTGTVTVFTQASSGVVDVIVSSVQQNGQNLHIVADYISPTALAAGAFTTKFQNASGAAVNLKASSGNLYGFSLTNETAAVAYIEFFNTAATPTLGTTAVVFAIKLPASANITIPPTDIALMNFTTGIGFACTTTENGTTAASITGMIFFQ
jgi:hypothetical protein